MILFQRKCDGFWFLELFLLWFYSFGLTPSVAHGALIPENFPGRCGPMESGTNEEPAMGVRIASAWSALPPRLQLEFPIANDRFFVGLDVVSTCRQMVFPSSAFEYDERSIINSDACWRPVKGTDQWISPQVLVQENAQNFGYRLLAATMTAYTEFFIDDFFGPTADAAVAAKVRLTPAEQQLMNAVGDFRKAREMLLRAYIDDLKESGHRVRILALAQSFQSSEGSLVDSVRAQNYVLSEFVAAYYCNERSAREFNLNGLVRSRGAFSVIADFLGRPWFSGK